LPRARVASALKNIAEVALGFGSPVSFQAPDTVWVDVSGSSHLYESERVLALELSAQIKLLGHSVRMAIAGGPWLAQSFARYSCLDSRLEDAEALLVDPLQTARLVGELPIISLPIGREAVTWFSRLGLLSIDDLRKLPRSTLASRLEGQVQKPIGIPIVLDLIHGHDAGVLTPHRPEELPQEELFWDDPLESVEPLLFALKGLASRLSARLEGRGQAAQELLLTIHHDRRILALTSTSAPESTPEGAPAGTTPDTLGRNSAAAYAAGSGITLRDEEAVHGTKKLTFQLASPLFHAEDLERVMRLRLQRQNLAAPHIGLSLQATAVAEARCGQVNLSESQSWKSGLSTDPRALTVLVAELTADIGAGAVGVLVAKDSHLLEKSSDLAPVRDASAQNVSRRGSSQAASFTASAAPQLAVSEPDRAEADAAERAPAPAERLQLPRLPTRLFEPPIEIHAPIRKNELWVVMEQAFIVRHIQFDERVEGVEWWDRERVFRDYFRVWLAKEFGQQGSAIPRWPHSRSVAPRGLQPRSPHPDSLHNSHRDPAPHRDHAAFEHQGLEALVYRDREQGKSYIHAIYD
jgi:protein ImuB